jgi:hypothetical protein
MKPHNDQTTSRDMARPKCKQAATIYKTDTRCRPTRVHTQPPRVVPFYYDGTCDSFSRSYVSRSPTATNVHNGQLQQAASALRNA